MTSESNTPARLVKCPGCGKQTKFTPGNPYRPFCSDRCKTNDLGAWADEKYAIPVAKPDPFHANVDPERDEEEDEID